MAFAVALGVLSPRAATAVTPDLPHVASTRLPIRVYYDAVAGQDRANEGLGYLEAAWDVVVTEMGFPSPRAILEDGTMGPGLLVVLDSASNTNHIQAYFPPDGGHECASEVVIPTTRPTSFFEMFSWYGLTVAAEYAANCTMSEFAFQPSAVAMTVVQWPGEPTFLTRALPAFQAHPGEGIDCMFHDDARYFYGAGSSLFELFLDERYGQGDGVLLSRLWNAAAQQVDNPASFFTTFQTVLGDTAFDEAFAVFAAWRYFVGERDDGGHFVHGGEWTGGEVATDATQAPSGGQEVNELGSSYVEFDLSRLTGEPLTVTFSGSTSTRWNVDLLLVRADKSAEIRNLVNLTSHATAVPIPDAEAFAKAVLVVSNLGPGSNHRPSATHCDQGESFTYQLTGLPQVVSRATTEDQKGCSALSCCSLDSPVVVTVFCLALLVRRRRSLWTCPRTV